MSNNPQGSIMNLGAKGGNHEEDMLDNYNIKFLFPRSFICTKAQQTG